MKPLYPLLGLLLRGDAYGYELKRTIETEFQLHWRIDFAQLYRTLNALSQRGWVRVRHADGEGGPARKIYAVTPPGRAAFERWLAQPAASSNEFWVKLRLGATLGHDVTPLLRGERARVGDAPPSSREPGASADLTAQLMDAVVARRLQAEREALEQAAQAFANRAPRARLPLVIAGSDDPLLAYLAQSAHAATRVIGSMAGLDAVAHSLADMAAAHLRAPERGEYNVPYVQRVMLEDDVVIVHFARREYGLVLAPGNPKKIRRVGDLVSRRARLVNRTRGAGARLWLAQRLSAAQVEPTAVDGWWHTAATYEAVAAAIAAGAADAGPGLRSTAQQRGLDFLPLGQEDFDLVMPRAVYESARGAKLLEHMRHPAVRAHALALGGYDVSRAGQVTARVRFGLRRKA